MKRKTKTKDKMKTKMKMTFILLFFSVQSRGAIDGQMSFTWPRSVIEFSFANFARGPLVPYMVYSLLIGIKVP